MKTARIDIGAIRREQIVDAAVAVIAERGLPGLSLSEIEKKVGMSRGQLTYYFRAKEDILLAVFDRMLQLMCKRQGIDPHADAEEHPFYKMTWLDTVRFLLEMLTQQPAPDPGFHALQFTFLSQAGHRDDFRRRLAQLYEEWRSHGAEHLTRDLAERPSARPVSPRAVSTLVQAILHGLVVQSAVDPDSFDAAEVAQLCLDMLNEHLWNAPAPRPNAKKRAAMANNKKGASQRARVLKNGVSHARN